MSGDVSEVGITPSALAGERRQLERWAEPELDSQQRMGRVGGISLVQQRSAAVGEHVCGCSDPGARLAVTVNGGRGWRSDG